MLIVPEEFSQSEYIIVETLQGTIIKTYTNSAKIDISQLPKGIYLVKTLSQQGLTRRVGTLVK